MEDIICGECWLEYDNIVCQYPEDHTAELVKTDASEEQLELFEN